MKNLGSSAGMGTSGLVGQVGTWAVMAADTPAWLLIINMALTQLILPGRAVAALCRGTAPHGLDKTRRHEAARI